MGQLDEILTEVKAAKSDISQLKSWLYGQNGFEGDMPEIKKSLKDHTVRIRRLELLVAALIGTGLITGGIISGIGWLGS